MADTSWMDDPALAGIDKNKMEFLASLFTQGAGLSQKEMVPFLMKLSKQSKEKNISFKKEEIQLMYSVLKKYSSTEELQKMEKFSSYFS